jgi:hypothetical protein
MNGRFRRRACWVASLVCASLGVAISANAQQAHVDLCHATGSAQNPYVLISPSVSGAFHGHLGHTGPVFDPDVHVSGGGWGDIIPEFQYQGQTHSLNWPQGQSILAADCQVQGAEEPPEVEVEPGPPVGPPAEPPEVEPGPPIELEPPFTG